LKQREYSAGQQLTERSLSGLGWDFCQRRGSD